MFYIKKERLTIENRMLIEQLLKLNYKLKILLMLLIQLLPLFLKKLKKEEFAIKVILKNVTN